RRIELIGFKSFSDRGEITVHDTGVTAIVGPNGCGKSNVSDAIAWVLGKQSAKSLRGEKMEDVIFNGTRNRAPMGMAEVTITLTEIANGNSNGNGTGMETEPHPPLRGSLSPRERRGMWSFSGGCIGQARACISSTEGLAGSAIFRTSSWVPVWALTATRLSSREESANCLARNRRIAGR